MIAMRRASGLDRPLNQSKPVHVSCLSVRVGMCKFVLILRTVSHDETDCVGGSNWVFMVCATG